MNRGQWIAVGVGAVALALVLANPPIVFVSHAGRQREWGGVVLPALLVLAATGLCAALLGRRSTR